ncbi:LysM peptidoglycan-binding domain-containing protein [Fuscovulum ytuae]|uniref:LysM peptidoglycan-binding domain-containing protein n=1 Tax=Fuscovulum ytuae TaxID=3042299 RepID=A0ABY8Q8C2_9RHOB|nr:LysM peptidoglycan-binding domain-containing protein [Fuscovulum sp. YMD61]WGV17123.1 LysM peptidoglycan-binding domain-containing protein [Fuscovulum sp. YMD61]
MKSWAEMDAAGRGGVVAVVGAIIALLFYGAWSVNRPPAVEEAAVTASGSQPEAAPAPVTTEATATSAAEPAPQPEETTAEAAESEAVADPATGAQASAPETVATEAETEVAVTEAAPDEAAPDEAAAGETAANEAAAGEAVAEPVTEVADVAPVAEVAVPAEENAAAAVVEEAAPIPPSFDLVRVEKDGSALVAGSAAAGSTVSLRVIGAELAAVPADPQGKFVAMFNLAPSAAPRVLSMVMLLADGTEVPAEATVVIGPTIAPVVVAEAEVPEAPTEAAEAAASTPEPQPETEAPAEAAPVAEAPAALLVTDEGAKVLQSAAEIAPELVANVTIDTITYTEAGAVQLAGRGTAGRVVRLYLDNAQMAEASISAAGDWAVTLPEVAPGVYVLRADQLDGEGKVTSRFETPFKRETVEALAAAAEAVAPTGVTQAEAGDGGADPAAAGSVDAGASSAGPTTVTVQPGFTLWRIATENLGAGIRYVQVFEANKDQIRDPDLIYPGQVFTIPAAE